MDVLDGAGAGAELGAGAGAVVGGAIVGFGFGAAACVWVAAGCELWLAAGTVVPCWPAADLCARRAARLDAEADGEGEGVTLADGLGPVLAL